MRDCQAVSMQTEKTAHVGALQKLCGSNPASAFSGKAGVLQCLLLLFAGSFAYGTVIGLWRAPLQALYAGVKLPLLLILRRSRSA